MIVGCGVGVYLFAQLLPLMNVEECGEIGLRISALIALIFITIPPLSLCSTGFKNNKKLCNFVSKCFGLLSLANIFCLAYVLSISRNISADD